MFSAMSEVNEQTAAADLSAAQRRSRISQLLVERETVTVRELVELFGVSNMTAHRDLDSLAQRGVLRKVRGGATAQPTALYESSLRYRLGENAEAKKQIAAAAARLVHPGSSILLDDSTTALAMAPHLTEIPGLTVVTTFVSLIEALAEYADGELHLIAIGGTYDPKYHAFGGVLAQEALRKLRVDQCFSANLVDLSRGAFHREAEQAAVKRTMIEVSGESILLADGSKFAKRGMHRIAGLDAFDKAVVDAATDDETRAALQGAGPQVLVAGV